MPNRILRDWTDSETVNSLSWQAEVFFVRLIMKVDDFGRFDSRPKLLRALLFPVRDGIRDTDISRWMAECQKAGLIRVYAIEGKEYLQIEKFNQRTRSEKSKYPDPPPDDGHMTVKRPSDDGHLLTYSEAHSETHSETETVAAKAADVIPKALDTPAFRQAWEDWKRHRVEIRKKLTPTSAERSLRKMSKWGVARAIAAIEHSIEKGWHGIYESRDTPPEPEESIPTPNFTPEAAEALWGSKEAV